MIDRKSSLPRHDSKGRVVYTTAHPHQWRHTFVHRLLKQDAPLEAVATLIGDTPKVVAQTYAHFIEERQAQLDKHAEAAWGLAR
jgi:site-specific recombinase XerD